MFVVPGFVSATDVRPADVFTSSLGNAKTVLEVPYSLTARTRCWVLIAFEPRLRPHMFVVDRNSEPCTTRRGCCVKVLQREQPKTSTVLPHAEETHLAQT